MHVVAKSAAIGMRTICQLVVITAALAIQFRTKLNFKAFEFDRLSVHNLVAARRLEPISALKKPDPGG
jgi:hypothetical protein